MNLTRTFLRVMRIFLRTVLRLFIIVFAALWGGRSGPKEDRVSALYFNQFDSGGNKDGPWREYEDSVLVAAGTYLGGAPGGLWSC